MKRKRTGFGVENDVELRSPRENIHYADKRMLGKKPLIWLRQGKKEDFMTPEEFVGNLYGREVAKLNIIFKDEVVS
ncbi:MAG: hypothetical protein LUH14_06185 [Clostridiaceae bacterium]|nr:hypothetical protein [Clostridiaceae bacterium]